LARRTELAEIKRRQGKKPEEARASSTDADATVMKMGDGGFRPAYNFQYGTDTESQVIVGVDVVTAGSDQGQMAPMVDQVVERCGRAPEHWLVDGGYPGHEQIDAVAERTTVVAPVPKPKARRKDKDGDPGAGEAAPPGKIADPHAPKAGDSEAVADWRQRMATDEAKARYLDRAATAECVNALARNRGMRQLPVRGLNKVKGVALLFALAHNLMRMMTLAPEMVGMGRATSGIQEMAA
jgi:hypothetical protein